MAGLPEVTVAGTLTADPDLRFTPSGACVVNFTIAANDRRYNSDTGKWEDNDATFLRCNLWRQPAEHLAESLSKGDRVLATGHLKERSYETREGDKRYVMELAVTEIGASLKFATLKVTKATRTGGNGDTASATRTPPATDDDRAPF